MTAPFHPHDAENLIAPYDVFEEDWPALDAGSSVTWNNAVRNCLALELAHQLATDIPGLVLKGGTVLQSRLEWPPMRASIDIDLEWTDADEVLGALGSTLDRWGHTGVVMDPPTELPFSVVTYVRFPVDDDEVPVRVDISPPGSSTELSEPWSDPPAPWKGGPVLQVPTLETQAAQKLFLAAPPDFGRDLDDHRGRQNLCKDLFDLHCLGALDLDSLAVQKAATVEIRTKADLLGGAWDLDRVHRGALKRLELFAHPRTDGPAETESLWRAYLRVRPFLRAPFADGDLRIAAGCAHHAVATIVSDGLDWTDSWMPRRTRGPRKAWQGVDNIETVVDVADGFGEARGLKEAWATPRRDDLG